MKDQRVLRLSLPYLKSKYAYSNYDDYVLVDSAENKIFFHPLGEGLNENILREQNGFDKYFFQEKLCSRKVLKKIIEGNGIMTYQPGTLFIDGRFYSHPIDLGYCLLNLISEDMLVTDYYTANVKVNLTFYSFEKTDRFRSA